MSAVTVASSFCIRLVGGEAFTGGRGASAGSAPGARPDSGPEAPGVTSGPEGAGVVPPLRALSTPGRTGLRLLRSGLRLAESLQLL